MNTLADRTKPELARWYNITLFSTVKQPPPQVIKKGNFPMTISLMAKHLPPSTATAKGHMRQTRKNVKYTKPPERKKQGEAPVEQLEQRTDAVLTKIIDPQQGITTDLTGRFPVTSNRGNKYLFSLYNCGSNSILARTTKTRTDNEFLQVFQGRHEHLSTRGLKPPYTCLDNEAPPALPERNPRK